MSNLFEPFIGQSEHHRRFVRDRGQDIGFEEALSDANDSQSIHVKRESKVFVWLLLFTIFVLSALIVRSAYLQISLHESYELLAEGNRNRVLPVLAPRGIIFDRYGNALVQNTPSFDLVLIPVDIPKEDEERVKLFENLNKLTGVPLEEITKKADEADPFSFQPVTLQENIERDKALVIEAQLDSLAGVQVEKTSKRYYTYGNLASHALGYVGKITAEELEEKDASGESYLLNDSIGKSGIEESYEGLLRGEHGKRQVEVDSRGGITKVLATREPDPGNNIVLSLDIELQKKLKEELVASADRAGVTRAAAVAMDPRNGEILALVNHPSYDNNLFADGISQDAYSELLNNPDRPLFNKASAGTYPPGSTFKPFVAAAALDEGIVTPETNINSTGSITVGAWKFYDYDLGGHGQTNLYKAISESVNTYFYYIGGGYEGFRGLGMDKISEYASKFGFGDYIGVDIESESSGLIPTPAWKEEVKDEPWYIGDTYNASIGQGDVSATPLQLASAYTVIANGGKYYRPHFLKETFSDDVNERTALEPELMREGFVTDTTLQEVKKAMRETVISGSGRSLEPLGIEAAGKTGTAQFVIPNSGGEKGEHAWFASFAPASDPKIVLIVLVEAAGEGHENAVPVARETLKWYFNRGDVQDKLLETNE